MFESDKTLGNLEPSAARAPEIDKRPWLGTLAEILLSLFLGSYIIREPSIFQSLRA